jgi:hypothetical protein
VGCSFGRYVFLSTGLLRILGVRAWERDSMDKVIWCSDPGYTAVAMVNYVLVHSEEQYVPLHVEPPCFILILLSITSRPSLCVFIGIRRAKPSIQCVPIPRLCRNVACIEANHQDVALDLKNWG